MKNKILKKLRVIAVLLVLLMTSACAQLQCDMNVYPNGDYNYEINIYVPEEFTELSTFNEDSLIAVARTIFRLGENEIIKPVTKNVDGINYKGLNIIHERSTPKDNGEIVINVDDWNNILELKVNHEANDDIWFELNPLGDAEEFMQFIKNNDQLFNITFHMPGEVISSSAGVVDGNDVTVSIIDNNFNDLTIVSKVPFFNTIEMIVLISILIIICVVLYFLWKKKKQKQEIDRINALKDSRKLKVIKEIEPYSIHPDGDIKISEEC